MAIGGIFVGCCGIGVNIGLIGCVVIGVNLSGSLFGGQPIIFHIVTFILYIFDIVKYLI